MDKKYIIATGVIAVFVATGLAVTDSKQDVKEAYAGIDIVSTENDQKCLTQTGMQLNPDGNIYIQMADGETYDMPLTDAIANANPSSYDALEEAAEQSIERKFCLEDWAVEIEIADGKYKNITIYNTEPL